MNRTTSDIHPQVGFNKLIGAQLIDWGVDFAKTKLEINESLLNFHGLLHGGVYCTFLDFSCGMAGTFTGHGNKRKLCVTLNLSTNFISSVTDGVIYGHAKRVGGGASIFFTEAKICDEAGKLLATATGTFKYISPKLSVSKR
ncbi:MAG: phenylacetic acid degradation protein [Blastopirellula sp.]|nr:MAG: phenylacetic acid degradation protein [Blastopirellula sp.]